MRYLQIAGGVAISAAAIAITVTSLCSFDQLCTREWLSATSGWAAVMAAIPTILYLSRQITDADRHQRIGFAIELRRHRILATRTKELAYTGIALIDMFQANDSPFDAPDIRSWDRASVDNILQVLRDETLAAFESEIAFPMSMGARTVAKLIEEGLAGDASRAHAMPSLLRSFFENAGTQAEAFLSEVSEITRHR